MEKIKIITLLESSIAINEDKWAKIWNTILERYKNNWNKLEIDFSDIRVVISPFMRSLLKPLYKNWLDFEWINFKDEISENIYNRVIEEFEKIWIESIREINI